MTACTSPLVKTKLISDSLPFALWDDRGECPVCGSDEIEGDLQGDYYECLDCGAKSQPCLTDDMELESILINLLGGNDEQFSCQFLL